jgi:pimeloyl-ACP methyl ester carboxylesterase
VEARRFTAADGVVLEVGVTGEPGELVPVVCLPGLTRNRRDFTGLAADLGAERLVVAVDLRGRGGSGWDPSGTTYRPVSYADDVLVVLDGLGIERAVLVGTSLGGLVSMLLGARDPGRVAGIALNDIGPEIAAEGMVRIHSYIGTLAPAATWETAAAQLRDATGSSVPGLDDAAWLERAHQQLREVEPGRIVADHDPVVAEVAKAADPRAVPAVWELFDALAPVPLLLLRGALSDLVAPGTVAEMRRRRPDLRVVEVPDRGHAPTLDEPEARAAIHELLAEVDA